MAKNHLRVSGQQVSFDVAKNSSAYNSHQSDLKIGQFTRVISPLIDILQATESTIKDKEASERVKTAQLLGLAAQGYNLKNSLSSALNENNNGVFNQNNNTALFRVESGIGLSHSRQSQEGRNAVSLGNVLNAKHIDVEARTGELKALGTDFTSRDEKATRQADSHIQLKAASKIRLEASQDENTQRGKNQHYGTEAGTALSVGAKTGWSFYAKEGFGKGKQESEGKSYRHTHLDTESLILNSGGDIQLKGASAKASRIEVESKGNLHIESVQEEHSQSSNQVGLKSQVEFGFGSAWDFKGNANVEKGKGNFKQVTEQSGLFAQGGGYHINADNIHLKGSAIVSTNPSQSELITNNLTFIDIENSSHYSAVSGGLSGSYSQSSPSINPSAPITNQGKDKSLTRAILSEGRITLNKDSKAVETTAKALGINTDMEKANRQVNAPKDINQLLKAQNVISQNIGHITSAASTFTHQQAATLEQEAMEAEKAGEYEVAIAKREEAKSWQIGGENKRRVDAITNAISLALSGQSPQAIATGAASPYVNQVIKKATENYPELNIPAHILWGAIEAELMGGKAKVGAIAAGLGEASTPILSQALFGRKEASELTAAEKQQLLNLSKLVAGIASGLVGRGNSAESLASISQGMKVAENAVENNALDASQSVDYLKELSEAIAQGISIDEVNEKYKAISQAEFEKDLSNCKQQGLMCYVGTLMAMDAGVKSAEGYKNYYSLPSEIQAQALDFIKGEAARHSIELVDTSPTMIQMALLVIEVGQEMYEAKNAGRSFSAEKAQANFAKKVRRNELRTKSSALPVPTPRKSSVNGETYTSNAKHTLGQAGRSDPNAGIEPRNSFELFEKSKVSGKQRFTIDENGNVHRFMNSNTSEGWHWAGSTSDVRNPLSLTSKQKSELKRLYPEHKKNPNLK